MSVPFLKSKIFVSLISIISILSISLYYYNYYYIQTLHLSDLIPQEKPIGSFAINLIDFDTGLTRHDISSLNEKSKIWYDRIQKINQIQDSYSKKLETINLLNEIIKDPQMKKISKKLFVLGLDLIEIMLKGILLY